METLSVLLALCARNSPVTGEFPSQRPVRWSFDVFFDLHLEYTVQQTIVRLVFWDAIALIMCHCNAIWEYLGLPILDDCQIMFHSIENIELSWCQFCHHWFIIIFAIMATSGAVSNDKVGIMTTFSVQCPVKIIEWPTYSSQMQSSNLGPVSV